MPSNLSTNPQKFKSPDEYVLVGFQHARSDPGALALWRVADPQISPALVLEALIMTRPQLQPIDTWSHAARLAPIVFLKSLTEKVNEIAQENNDLDEMAISSRKVGYLLRKDLGLKTVRSSSGPEHLKGGYTIIWNGP